MNEKLACEKFCQILSAVEYCHLKNIVHRDLKVNTINLFFLKGFF
jgi:serine/threonine-protein kinase SIK2